MLAPSDTSMRDNAMVSKANASSRRRSEADLELIAIVDDDDDARDQLEHGLRRAGYRTRGFQGGREALSALAQEARPDLIILDLVMPDVDGWMFRLEQRSHASLREIPVIVMSGDGSPKAATIDADAYMQKPCRLERLLPLIEQVLAVAERRKLLARSVEIERLRSLGMLVSSVAHEVNNPLVYVSGNLELALRDSEQLAAHPGVAQIAASLSDRLNAAQEGTHRISLLVTSAPPA